MRTLSYRAFRLPRLLGILAVLAGLLAVAPPAAFAAGSSVVTTCDDTVGPATPGSLRAAVEAANADGTSTDIDPHVITFALDPACDTITLAGEQLVLDNHVDIQGPGADVLAVSANELSRVFKVTIDVTATISGLTITDAYDDGSDTDIDGGGILNHGTLTVANSIITDNETVNIGGGIATSFGVLTVIDSTISNNEATGGGGLNVVFGTLIVTNSTISDNAATNQGGGIDVNYLGSLTMTNSTVSGNTAEIGGGVNNVGEATIVASTITANTAGFWGGGIANFDLLDENAPTTLTLTASIVAGNSLSDNVEAEGPDIYGPVTTATYSLIGDDTASTGLTDGVDGNIVGTEVSLVDPMLGPLADNTGPTMTHALLSGSPAIDHIPALDCAVDTDQRGVTRPQGVACDIGAFEVLVYYFQACLYAGSLTQVGYVGNSTTSTLACGRGAPLLLQEGEDYFACLFAGALSQVGTTSPTNCGRGAAIGLTAGDGLDDLNGCLFAGALSQLRFGSAPASCGRGVPISLEGMPAYINGS